MQIQDVNQYRALQKSQRPAQAAGSQAAPEQQEAASPAVRQDRLELGGGDRPVTYRKSQASNARVEMLRAAEQQRLESFQNMLRSMVVKQGQLSNLTLFGMDLFVTPEQSSQAAASIAEGGEYSVDAVATRILDMAQALAGGDSSKLSELREAVQKGFDAAGLELGGNLPGICQDTYTEVMRRFDEWERQAAGGGASA